MCNRCLTLCQGLFIGRTLRSRHPPEYFQGSMALPSTEPEVYEIFLEGFDAFLESDQSVLICDGIPRLPSQVHWLTETLATRPQEAIRPVGIRLEVSEAVQASRAAQRGGTASERALTESRLQKDRGMLEDVYNEIELIGGWRGLSINADADAETILRRFMLVVQNLLEEDLSVRIQKYGVETVFGKTLA